MKRFARKESAWRRKISELCRDRTPVIRRHFLNQELPGDKTLLRHLHRELNFYEMRLMAPDFARLEAELRRRRALGREIDALLKKAGKLVPRFPVPLST